MEKIAAIDEKICEQAVAHWNQIAKPIHSLGLLEDAIVKIAGIQGSTEQIRLDKAALIILCGDHGVVAEQVTQTDATVTRIVSENFTKGNTSAAIMAREAKVSIYPVDIGIATDGMPESESLQESALTNRKIRKGTGNIVCEPAMSYIECEQAIQVGISLVKELKEKGYQILATGEMGIGNTTPSSALAAVLLQQPVEVVTGKGAGLTTEGLERKIQSVKKAVARYQKKCLHGKDNESTKINETTKASHVMTKEHVIKLMAELGGLEIAGMMGVFIGGAIYKVPILIDGMISAIAALAAVRYEKKVADYLLASHVSKEPAGGMVLDALSLKPFLTCEMCLGEGTGAITAIPILRLALAVYQGMSTFQENAIDEYIPYEDC